MIYVFFHFFVLFFYIWGSAGRAEPSIATNETDRSDPTRPGATPRGYSTGQHTGIQAEAMEIKGNQRGASGRRHGTIQGGGGR